MSFFFKLATIMSIDCILRSNAAGVGGTCSDPVPDVAAADVEAEHHGDAEPHHGPGALLRAGQEAAPAAGARPGGGHTHAGTASPRPGQMSTATNPPPASSLSLSLCI